MKIAILSWGSLIKTGITRGLNIRGEFLTGGPMLPIEFSRISQSGERTGCLTVVIDEKNGVHVPTQYAVSAHQHLDWALSNLRFVESITLKYSVGYVNLISGTERGWARENQPYSVDLIKSWAQRNHFDAVIWTGLLSNFEKVTQIPFTVQSAVNYIDGLSPQLKDKALDYIKNVPIEIITPVRSVLSGTISINPPVATLPEDVECVRDGETALMRYLQRNRRDRR